MADGQLGRLLGEASIDLDDADRLPIPPEAINGVAGAERQPERPRRFEKGDATGGPALVRRHRRLHLRRSVFVDVPL
ncbi:MAG: hypothetical protein M3Q43_09845, partial [Actinomycetota bacterium]|nr:hypothetical protein [Actinomycetota bacterium]